MPSIDMFMLFCNVTQILYYSLVFRQDIDVGFVVLGNLQKKSMCINLRIKDIVESLKALKLKQLHLLYVVIKLKTNRITLHQMSTVQGHYCIKSQ